MEQIGLLRWSSQIRMSGRSGWSGRSRNRIWKYSHSPKSKYSGAWCLRGWSSTSITPPVPQLSRRKSQPFRKLKGSSFNTGIGEDPFSSDRMSDWARDKGTCWFWRRTRGTWVVSGHWISWFSEWSTTPGRTSWRSSPVWWLSRTSRAWRQSFWGRRFGFSHPLTQMWLCRQRHTLPFRSAPFRRQTRNPSKSSEIGSG